MFSLFPLLTLYGTYFSGFYITKFLSPISHHKVIACATAQSIYSLVNRRIFYIFRDQAINLPWDNTEISKDAGRYGITNRDILFLFLSAFYNGYYTLFAYALVGIYFGVAECKNEMEYIFAHYPHAPQPTKNVNPLNGITWKTK